MGDFAIGKQGASGSRWSLEADERSEAKIELTADPIAASSSLSAGRPGATLFAARGAPSLDDSVKSGVLAGLFGGSANSASFASIKSAPEEAAAGLPFCAGRSGLEGFREEPTASVAAGLEADSKPC